MNPSPLPAPSEGTPRPLTLGSTSARPEGCLLSCLRDVFSPTGRRGIHPVPQEEVNGENRSRSAFGTLPPSPHVLHERGWWGVTPRGERRVLGPWTLGGRQHSGPFSGPGAFPVLCALGGHPVRSHRVVQEQGQGHGCLNKEVLRCKRQIPCQRLHCFPDNALKSAGVRVADAGKINSGTFFGRNHAKWAVALILLQGLDAALRSGGGGGASLLPSPIKRTDL